MAQTRRKRSKPKSPSSARWKTLRGNAIATIDEAGRLKLPAGFRRTISDRFGPSLYVTSLDGDGMWAYPIPVWEAREERLLANSRQHPAVAKFLARTSYFGAEVTMDAQGRILVPAVLRSAAQLAGEVAVLGALDHLEVWNNALFKRRLSTEPFSAEDHSALAELGI